MIRTLSILGFVAWSFSMVACTVTKATPDAVPGATGPGAAGPDAPVVPPSPDELACTGDADCVVVETKCCDHCNGGAAVAFNTAHAAARKPTGCEQTMCTERGCGAAVAKCTSGQCAVEIQPIGG